jgi:hypothetical protein
MQRFAYFAFTYRYSFTGIAAKAERVRAEKIS